jgi:hypothetical protein
MGTMSDFDNRQITRDSLFIMAELRLDGQDTEHRIKVRNLSVGGMMAEGALRVTRGEIVWVNLRNVGWVEGSVAWVHDSRFGVAFREEVDPKTIRATGSPQQQLPDAMILNRRWAAPQPPRAPARKII